MKIAFFTETKQYGKVPRKFPNMRTDLAWMCALNADHYYFNSVPEAEYDLGIAILSKKNPTLSLEHIKTKCKKVAIMQEGPHWFFQDYSLQMQIGYYSTLLQADIIFTHNRKDQLYYKGLTNHPDVRILPSLMIEDSIGELKTVERNGVIIGGNFVSWYGGFDSFIVASTINQPIYSPKMGRRQQGEEQLGITQLPYLQWGEWIHKLNEFKIGVHLMRTHAAGTFALNCAYLGIPCIGYEELDTQEICHPSLTVKVGNLLEAKKLIRKLNEDKDFYDLCSLEAKQNYKQYYHEDQFNTTWKEQFKIS